MTAWEFLDKNSLGCAIFALIIFGGICQTIVSVARARAGIKDCDCDCKTEA